jgi:hypothetical protein
LLLVVGLVVLLEQVPPEVAVDIAPHAMNVIGGRPGDVSGHKAVRARSALVQPPQNRPDTRDELSGIERLWQIVVRSTSRPRYLAREVLA